MRFRELRAFLIQRGGILARNFKKARTAEPALDANSFASLGIDYPLNLCRDNTPSFDQERNGILVRKCAARPHDLQRSQCKPLKPAPSTHFKHNFQRLCTLDVENEEEVKAGKK
jgi:hypothetical protein